MVVVLTLLTALVSSCGNSAATDLFTVRAIDVPGPGRVLSNGVGYPLYVYLPDNRGQSRCTTACAAAWPPFVLPSGIRRAVAGPGIKLSLLGTTRRSDGSLQVTYNGWPLYTYVGDVRGQATGQAEGMGAWYLLSTQGTVDRQPLTGQPRS
jgi:predicted lipoprotein with Yx(FWY)xxD motif